jgi:hypothetical protein
MDEEGFFKVTNRRKVGIRPYQFDPFKTPIFKNSFEILSEHPLDLRNAHPSVSQSNIPISKETSIPLPTPVAHNV